MSRSGRIPSSAPASPIAIGSTSVWPRAAWASSTRASTSRPGRPVAVKFVHEAFAALPTLVKRFEREVAAMSAGVTPATWSNIVDSGVQGGVPYLVMDFHEGSSLGDLLEKGALARAARHRSGAADPRRRGPRARAAAWCTAISSPTTSWSSTRTARGGQDPRLRPGQDAVRGGGRHAAHQHRLRARHARLHGARAGARRRHRRAHRRLRGRA